MKLINKEIYVTDVYPLKVRANTIIISLPPIHHCLPKQEFCITILPGRRLSILYPAQCQFFP